jgi:hypothetical protein
LCRSLELEASVRWLSCSLSVPLFLVYFVAGAAKIWDFEGISGIRLRWEGFFVNTVFSLM